MALLYVFPETSVKAFRFSDGRLKEISYKSRTYHICIALWSRLPKFSLQIIVSDVYYRENQHYNGY